MNRREAKRQVCWHAAQILANALDTSDDTSGLTDVDGPDEGRLDEAWSDLISELVRRGKSARSPGDAETERTDR